MFRIIYIFSLYCCIIAIVYMMLLTSEMLQNIVLCFYNIMFQYAATMLGTNWVLMK